MSHPRSVSTSPAVRLFRIYAGLVFSFAWVPVMYVAFTVDRGFDSSQYMRLWSVYYLAMVLAEMPWGWVADRIGPRPLLVCGPLLLAVGFAVPVARLPWARSAIGTPLPPCCAWSRTSDNRRM